MVPSRDKKSAIDKPNGIRDRVGDGAMQGMNINIQQKERVRTWICLSCGTEPSLEDHRSSSFVVDDTTRCGGGSQRQG